MKPPTPPDVHVIRMSGTHVAECGQYLRRDPQSGALYQILFEHLETFLARSAADPARASLPVHVQRELRGYLTCGILAHGFCRFH